MKTTNIAIGIAGVVAMYLVSGCVIVSNTPPAQAKRTVELVAPLPANPTLIVQTHNGDIHVKGNAYQCRLIATITGRGWNEQQACDLINQVGIELKPSGNNVVVEVHKPSSDLANTISIAYDIDVPNPCGLDLVSHNGKIAVEFTQGPIRGESYNGAVEIKASRGTIIAKSHNGKITAHAFSDTLEATTNNGDVELDQAPDASAAARIQAVSHNGSIHLTAVKTLSAKAHFQTHNGSIRCDVPIMVSGEIDKQNLNGIIGSGDGQLSLETHNGSIYVRQ
jgi:DUF4097 and DUF4098 domain-containing protein YvlB